MKLKPFIQPLLIIFIATVLGFFAHYRTDGFSVKKIIGEIEDEAKWSSSLDDEKLKEVQNILSQPFSYLARGRQTFVFESQDKEYVIKFINLNRFRYPDFVLSLPFRQFFKDLFRVDKKDRRPFRVFNSHLLAYSELNENAKYEYVHLSRTDHLNKKITIIDRSKKEYLLDLDKSYFLLQKNGEPLFSVLKKIKNKNDFLTQIEKILHLIKKRCDLCIVDDDLNVGNNFGFYQDEVMIFDSGMLYKDENLLNSDAYKRELLKSTKFFRRDLLEKYPDSVPFLDEKIEQILLEKFGSS